MIFDHELFFTKSGKTTLSVTTSSAESDKISIEASAYKESVKPSWVFPILILSAVTPSGSATLTVSISGYVGSTKKAIVTADASVTTAAVAGTPILFFVAPLFPEFPDLDSLLALDGLAVSYVLSAGTMSIKAKLLPFKI